MDIFRQMQKCTLMTKDWGGIDILKPIPIKGDCDGVLRAIEGTVWRKLIKRVSNENYQQAIYGFGVPLLNELGKEPKYLLKQIPKEIGECALKRRGECINASDNCYPGDKTPICYEVIAEDPNVSALLSYITLSWVEGRYVCIVEE
jgi:hypothetical protein